MYCVWYINIVIYLPDNEIQMKQKTWCFAVIYDCVVFLLWEFCCVERHFHAIPLLWWWIFYSGGGFPDYLCWDGERKDTNDVCSCRVSCKNIMTVTELNWCWHHVQFITSTQSVMAMITQAEHAAQLPLLAWLIAWIQDSDYGLPCDLPTI